MSIKEKTISGLTWSFLDRFASQSITFIVGIILARLLSPEEFGLIGMLTIFIGLSTVFTQSGFNQALIRKIDCTGKDYSTVFYFNLVVSVALYLVLYFSSGMIGEFYDKAQLDALVKVLGLVLVINALTIVQRTQITKRIDFKLLTKISFISIIGSGATAIIMAATGFGVWSLVYKQIAQRCLEGGLLWYWNGWRPKEKFSKASFKELFSFGSHLMILGVIDAIYINVYHVIIGKFYPVSSLGHYTRAVQLKRLPSETLGSNIERVSYPVLSSIQDDKKKYISVFERLLGSTMLITFVALIGLASVAKEFTIVLMGEQWGEAGEYLQILCFSAMFYPLGKLLNSLLKVSGRSDLVLKLGIISKVFAIPSMLTAIFLGITPMLYLMIVERVATMMLIGSCVSKFAGLNTWRLFMKILPSLLIAMLMFIVLQIYDQFVELSAIAMLLTKIGIGGLLTIGIFELVKFSDYLYLKQEGFCKLTSRVKGDS